MVNSNRKFQAANFFVLLRTIFAKARSASFTEPESGKTSATSGDKTTILLPAARRLTYLPRTPLLKSYSFSISGPRRVLIAFVIRKFIFVLFWFEMLHFSCSISFVNLDCVPLTIRFAIFASNPSLQFCKIIFGAHIIDFNGGCFSNCLLHELFILNNVSIHAANFCVGRCAGTPYNMPLALMSSSISGQCTPWPPPMISKLFRCSGVASDKRHDHASGTLITRPSTRKAVIVSSVTWMFLISGSMLMFN